MALFCSFFFFFWLSNILLYKYTTSSLSIHLSMDVHLFVSVNSASGNVQVHVSFQIMVFSRYRPNSGTDGIAESYDDRSIFSF